MLSNIQVVKSRIDTYFDKKGLDYVRVGLEPALEGARSVRSNDDSSDGEGSDDDDQEGGSSDVDTIEQGSEGSGESGIDSGSESASDSGSGSGEDDEDSNDDGQ